MRGILSHMIVGGVGARSLDELSDVDLATAPPTIGQTLLWDGTVYAPGDAGSGGGTGLFRGAWTPQALRLPPQMSNNTTPAPYVANASTNAAAAYQCFDRDTVNRWNNNFVSSLWVSLDMGQQRRITRYAITVYLADRAPRTWALQGSNDGTAWTDVDNRTGQVFSTDQRREFTAAAPDSFRYYRLNVTQGGSSSSTALKEIEYYEDSTQPYMGGEYVTHSNRLWRSNSDNNGTEPGVSGWTEVPVGYGSGVTAARPTNWSKGPAWFDETLGKPIWWTGTSWVDGTGAAV